MNRLALSAVLLFVFPANLQAKPWAEMTLLEVQQTRAAVAPFVLATVNCIAGAIPGNPKALSYAQKRQWLAAAASTGNACDASFFQMKNAIDALVVSGAGQQYAATSFRKELPGNLAQRVKLARAPIAKPQAAPQASVAAQVNPEADAARKKLLEAATDKQLQCVRKTAADLVPYSNESAETLSSVIIDKCAASQAEQVDVVVATYGLSRNRAEGLAAEMADRVRRRIVSEIVTLRAEATKAASAATSAPSSQGFNSSERGVVSAGKSY